MTNKPATHFVARDRRASRDFCLFLDRYVSDLPLSADSPEFLPDWSAIMLIIETIVSRCSKRNMIFIASMGVSPFFMLVMLQCLLRQR